MRLSEKQNPLYWASQSAKIVKPAVGTVLIISWILNYALYGFDFMDESFYLVWMSTPFIYSTSATQVGFLYHLLYVVLGGDITSLRWANILLAFGLGWILIHALLLYVTPGIRDKRVQLHAAAVGLATSSLIFLNTWLSTLGYNSQALRVER